MEPTEEDTAEYRVLYDIPNYQEFWEPLMVLPYTAPWHDERFVGFGFNRNSHVRFSKLVSWLLAMLWLLSSLSAAVSRFLPLSVTL